MGCGRLDVGTIGPLRRLFALLSVSVLAACGDGEITVIDPSIPPRLVDGDHLVVTLENGDEVTLPIRGEPQAVEEKTECAPDVYEAIGSLTFVERILAMETFGSPQAEAARRAELRERILRRREALEQAFLDEFRAGGSKNPETRWIQCNLVLQPDDLIYMRLRFFGSPSSKVTVDCLGDGDARAQIRNPASVSMLKDKDEDPAMLEFRAHNCGIEPLTEGGDIYVDELGAVKSRCDPVTDVRINNCRIRGRTEAASFGGDLATLSMIRADHVQRLQESAPQHVVFSGVRMDGRYRGVLHLQPGVHHFTVQNSELFGAFVGITIHLPADGGWNNIRSNTITGQRKKGRFVWSLIGKKREVISIDSSEHNRIVNNHISNMKYGGIEFYRNCGEKGGIRHRVPQYNQIINNIFDYSDGGNLETIVLGSRDDRSIRLSFGRGVKGYCHKDEGDDGSRFAGNDVPMPWDTQVVQNSSESNDDWAQLNVIADNQAILFPRSPPEGVPRIKLSSKAKKLDNFLIGNQFVHDRSLNEARRIQRSQRAGCAVLAGVTHGMRPPFLSVVRNGALPYIRNEQTEKYFWDIRPVVRLTCGTALQCRDNRLFANEAIACDEPLVRDYGADSQACDAPDSVCVEGSNNGDEHELGCGTNLLAVQAACNLEFGRASDTHRDRTLMNRVNVVRASDDKDDGRCRADGTSIKDGQRLILPWLLQRYEGAGARPNLLRHACREHDRNGGDCHVNIRHYCEAPGPVE